jgi:hypothetical protein
MVVISVMCGAIVLFAVVFLIYDARNRKKTSKVARHIVIASAAFDEFGRILVKSDGTLPMHVIETDAAIDVSLLYLAYTDESVCWPRSTLDQRPSNGFSCFHSIGVYSDHLSNACLSVCELDLPIPYTLTPSISM